ncbi:hypothetical protein AYR66_04495 [Noviherbaspirillum denitrificans]|uniref:Uncharacterized protein n=1 Tax=Noviherbaspirillum denitrificans TaxID=1968433 RepID=A0A254T853_9BURK|nr:hypothetical protein AYR66_04495 [Noviherbaspirillum denitrificans]
MLAECGQRRLAGDDQHRNVVVVGAGDTGDQVGRTGAGGGTADADVARLARVAVGHEGRACFMARKDVADAATALAAGQGVIQRLDRPAGYAKYIFNANLLEVSHQQVSHFRHVGLGVVGSR